MAPWRGHNIYIYIQIYVTAIEVTKRKGDSDDSGQRKDWDDATLVAERKSEDDVDRSARLAGGGELDYRSVRVRGEILCDHHPME